VTAGPLVLLITIVAATVVGLAVSRYNGHFRGSVGADDARAAEALDSGRGRDRLETADVPGAMGQRATLLQFSSAFCAPCRATRRVLGEVAAMVPGVQHVEVDAEKNLDLVRRLGVRRTPTTFVLDAHGGVITRASGAPTKAAVIAAVGRAVD
jgi:thiol-disulfide isomerase/thioredoxin